MYATLRTYEMAADWDDELVRHLNEGFISQVAQVPGFVAYYVIDAGNGILITVTVGDDPDVVQQSADMAAEFVRDELSHLEIERVEAASGEVTVSKTAIFFSNPNAFVLDWFMTVRFKSADGLAVSDERIGNAGVPPDRPDPARQAAPADDRRRDGEQLIRQAELRRRLAGPPKNYVERQIRLP